MVEPCSKNRRKFKSFWMAEPGHPHEVGVLHKLPLLGGPTSLREKKLEFKCKAVEE